MRSFGAGFIFTTSLPPTVLAGAIASIRLLRFVLDIHHACCHPHLISGVKRDVPCDLNIRTMWPTFERNFAMLGLGQDHHNFQNGSHSVMILPHIVMFRCQCSTPPPISFQCTLAIPFSPPLSPTTFFATTDTTFRWVTSTTC